MSVLLKNDQPTIVMALHNNCVLCVCVCVLALTGVGQIEAFSGGALIGTKLYPDIVAVCRERIRSKFTAYSKHMIATACVAYLKV